MTHGRPIDGFWVGAGHNGKTNHVTRGLEGCSFFLLLFVKRVGALNQVILAQPLGREEGLEIEFNYMSNDSINHV